jgi:thioesterase domain-containing protein
MPYFCLANYLPALDFYGISSERFGDRKRCFANLEEMAQSYLKALDPLVGERPLILGGFCTGGAVAYEMAQQLKRSGKKINGLVLIDSYKIQSFGSQESRDAASSALLNNIGVDSDSILGKRITYEMEKNRRLVANYKPTPHDGPTLLVQCGKFDEDDVNREHLQRLTPQLNGWATKLNNLTLTQVQLDASHKTIMNDEVHVRAVGDAISSFVESLGNDF